MARYYFNLHECGRITHDDEGSELPTIDAARNRAVREARAIMCAEVLEGRLCLGCSIEVLDDRGRLAANVPFTEVLALSGV